MIKWQQKESTKALEGYHPYVRKFAIEKKVEVETCTIDQIRRWTHVLKQIFKKK